MYDFKLVHIAGKKHKAPDALSHCWHTEADGGHKENPEESSDKDIPVYQMHPAFEEKPPVRIGAAQWTDKGQDLQDIVCFSKTFKLPETTSTKQQQRFLNLATWHYLQEDQLYRQHPSGNNQKVLMTEKDQERILAKLHDSMEHCGEWVIREAIRIWFYWLGIRKDITWYVKSCHTCQLHSMKKMHIPVNVSWPVALFHKVYLDIMKMPEVKGKNWIMACRDDMSSVSKGRALALDNARALASFFMEQIIFCYGTVGEVVTDNRPSLRGEFSWIVNKYNIHQIKISPYNSQANGVVEHGHFTIQEVLVKMCGGEISKWPTLLPAVLFADWITVQQATGFSPYYLLHGVNPILPCNLAEVTFMIPQPKEHLTDSKLLIAWTCQIAKMPDDLNWARETLSKSRFRSKEAFEAKFGRWIHQTSFKPGDFVLIWNTQNEKTVAINRKIKNQCMGPYQVVQETRGKTYVIEELNGNVLHTLVAAFWLIPYVKREHLDGWAWLVEAWDQNQSGKSDGSASETRTEEE